jgi:hypothetical protein
MNLDQAAFFFTGSILIMLGFVVITAGVVVINYLLHTYWKPVRFFKFLDHPYPPRFMKKRPQCGLAKKPQPKRNKTVDHYSP